MKTNSPRGKSIEQKQINKNQYKELMKETVCSLRKINKIGKPLSKLTKKQKKNIQNKKTKNKN